MTHAIFGDVSIALFFVYGNSLPSTYSGMGICFVIQPFDCGKFDKRFEDVFAPAIRDAGLEPYRVDQDPKVEVPIQAIEKGILAATVCLAEITLDSPNVWYELGFAFASGRSVVMVCSPEERTGKKYPFDIQHRTIIQYLSGSTQDFEKLKQDITTRLKALAESGEAIRQLAQTEQVAPVEGLSQSELVLLAAIAGRAETFDGVPVFMVKQDVERSGFTAVAFALGLRRLLSKDFVVMYDSEDGGGYFRAVKMTDTAWAWMEKNEGKFLLRHQSNEVDDPPF